MNQQQLQHRAALKATLENSEEFNSLDEMIEYFEECWIAEEHFDWFNDNGFTFRDFLNGDYPGYLDTQAAHVFDELNISSRNELKAYTSLF